MKAENRRQSRGQVVKPTTGAKAEDRRESQGWLTKLWTWTLPHVISFTACPRLCCLVLTLPPVLGFHACSRLCSLSTAFFPVLNFLACPQLWRLLPALLHVLVFATWYQLLYLTPASIPHLGHHPPWLGYSARKLAFGQTPHVGWPSGLRPSAITILQYAASLAAGGYNRPCVLMKSLFR